MIKINLFLVIYQWLRIVQNKSANFQQGRHLFVLRQSRMPWGFGVQFMESIFHSAYVTTSQCMSTCFRSTKLPESITIVLK